MAALSALTRSGLVAGPFVGNPFFDAADLATGPVGDGLFVAALLAAALFVVGGTLVVLKGWLADGTESAVAPGVDE